MEKIRSERSELRTANSKHYINADGSITGLLFCEPVHFLDGGKLIEINNELSENGQAFENRSNKFKLKFERRLNQRKILSFDEGKYGVEFLLPELTDYNSFVSHRRYNGEAYATMSTKSNRRRGKATEARERLNGVRERLNSRVKYNDFRQGADLEYAICSDRLKENIVVKERGAEYIYTFVLKLRNLTITSGSGSSEIILSAIDSGEVKYTIPAPFMYDSKDVYSNSVNFTLSRKTDNEYEFKVIADAAWINAPERELPVVIDPQIITSGSSYINIKSYIGAVEMDVNGQKKYIGNKNGQYECKIIVNSGSLIANAFDKYTRIINATLELTQIDENPVQNTNGFEVTIGGSVKDCFKSGGPIQEGIRKICVDLTEKFNEAIKNPTPSFTIDLKSCIAQTNDYISIASENHLNPAYKPVIMVDYISERTEGSEGVCLTKSALRAGIVRADLRNGNLDFTHTDIVGKDLTISHIYNNMNEGKTRAYNFGRNGSSDTELTQEYCMGKGWKLNLQQNLIKHQEPDNGLSNLDGRVLTYIDGAGNRNAFLERYYYLNDEKEKVYIKAEERYWDTLEQKWYYRQNIDDTNPRPVEYEVTTDSDLQLSTLRSRYIYMTDHDFAKKDTYKCTIPSSITYSTKKDYTGNLQFVFYYYGSYTYVAESDVILSESDFQYRYKVNNAVVTRKKVTVPATQASITIPDNRTVSIVKETQCINGEGIDFDSEIYPQDEDIVNIRQYIADLEAQKYETLQGIEEYEATIEAVNYEMESNALMHNLTLDYMNAQARYRDEQQAAENAIKAKQDEYKDAEGAYKNVLLQMDIYNTYNNIAVAKYNYDKGEVSQETYNGLNNAGFNYSYNVVSGKKNQYTNYYVDKSRMDFDRIEATKELTKKQSDYEKEIEKQKNGLKIFETAITDAEAKMTNMRFALSQASAEKQKEQLRNQILQLKAQITVLNKVIEIQTARLDEFVFEAKKKPMDYVIDSAGTIYGFDYYGRLIEITDKNGKTAQITYEYDNNKENYERIISIADPDGGGIYLEYKNGLLDTLTDTQFRKTFFAYNYGGELATVTYPDGTISRFEYNSNKFYCATDASGFGIEILYLNGRVSELKEFTRTLRIDETGVNYSSNPSPLYGDYNNIIYGTGKSVETINKAGVKTGYIFDKYGNIITTWQNDPAQPGTVRSTSNEYRSRKRALRSTNNLYAAELLKQNKFTYTTSSQILPPVTNPNLTNTATLTGGRYGACDAAQILRIIPDTDNLMNYPNDNAIFESAFPDCDYLVLSGWVKATSAFIARERYAGDKYKAEIFEERHAASMDAIKEGRRFELRATVHYTKLIEAGNFCGGYDNSSGSEVYGDDEYCGGGVFAESDRPMSEEFYCSFDYLNSDWQYVSVPVKIWRDNAINRIEIVCDYANNLDTVTFGDISLRPGKCEESEYNTDGTLAFIRDMSGWTSYTYDDKKNIVKALRSDNDGMHYPTEYVYSHSGLLAQSIDHNGVVTEYSYDMKGNVERTVSYHKSEPSGKVYSESVTNPDGTVQAELDPRGNIAVEYEYYESKGLLLSAAFPNGGKTVYGYDYRNDQLTDISGNDDGTNNRNVFKYTAGYLMGAEHHGIGYSYAYDGFGRKVQTNVAGGLYCENSYDDIARTAIVKYAADNENNRESFKTAYDAKGRTSAVQYKKGVGNWKNCTEYLYNSSGAIERETEFVLDETEKIEYNYKYDMYGNVTARNIKRTVIATNAETNLGGENFTHDKDFHVTEMEVTADGVTKNYGYEYDDTLESKLSSVTLPSTTPTAVHKESIGYDGLGRAEKTAVSIDSEELISEQKYYLKNGDHTTPYVASIRYGLKGETKDVLKYTYDANGNIQTIKENGILKARYAYDSLNRLIREDNFIDSNPINADFNKTVIYAYDAGGNITTKTVYPYTLTENLTEGMVIPYVYRSEDWRDQLLSYNGQAIGNYDALGNPGNYKGYTLLWEKGRQLKSIAKTGTNLAFEYNAAGIRTKKTINGITHTYYLTGSRINREVYTGYDIWYLYGSSGVIGLIVNGQPHYFRKNLQGDVTHIVNEAGAVCAIYHYNAWGKHKVLNNDGSPATDATHIGNINSIRYRSYYWDNFDNVDSNGNTTGLYCLPQRYYDSEIGRFLNADSMENAMLQMREINGFNPYAFCLNNPVNYSDPTGGFVITSFIVGIIIAAAIGGVVGFGASVVSQGISNGWDNINWWQAGVAGLLGAVGGALTATGLGAWAMAGIGAGLGFIGGMSDALFEGKDFGDWHTWLDIGVATAIGFVAGGLSGKGASHFKNLNPAYYSDDLVRANQKHALNLVKSATGQFKSGAGAASALRASGKALNIAVTASKVAVNTVFKQQLALGLLKGCTSQIALQTAYAWIGTYF